jgi:hypothetical protein
VRGRARTVLVKNELYTDLQRTIADRHDDYWVVCQGHDLLKILCLIFPRLLSTYEPSSKNEKDLYHQSIDPFISNEKNLMKHLAMCYEMSDFEQTKMHAKIRNWEANNQPYIVLRI